jgi:transposase-like protein
MRRSTTMAEVGRMTAADVVAGVLAGEHGDFVREAVALRQSSYFPSFLEPRRRSEQAIVAVVLEAYVNGVSTRKVDRLVEQLGIEGMSKDRVSAMCRGLDEQVELFRGRPFGGQLPVPVA